MTTSEFVGEDHRRPVTGTEGIESHQESLPAVRRSAVAVLHSSCRQAMRRQRQWWHQRLVHLVIIVAHAATAAADYYGGSCGGVDGKLRRQSCGSVLGPCWRHGEAVTYVLDTPLLHRRFSVFTRVHSLFQLVLLLLLLAAIETLLRLVTWLGVQPVWQPINYFRGYNRGADKIAEQASTSKAI